ncbi:MAG: hypothetical protein J7M03_04865 [Candidatus Desulfofervidaceae bacterium]|nr:hypothetical protein [Candidatus Desulfofervidaceae bacterium]MDL1970016.1 hypothetical protein [Candidatus Desulfofervidaceae bacterium]
MQDYKKVEELWVLKHNKIRSLLLCCQEQRANLNKGNYEKFFLLQEEKLKIIREVNKIDTEISSNPLSKKTGRIEEIGRNIKKEVEYVIRCEEEVRAIVEKKQAELKERLARLCEGLNLLRHYRGLRTKESGSRFLNIRG